MLIASLWAKQPGRFFCISTKGEPTSRHPKGQWKDHFFSKDEFGEIRHFLKENADKDIYFCPHGFMRRARQKEEAVLPTMCWADLDYSDPRKLNPKPTIAFESSPGRFVGLWITNAPITESLNRRLTYAVDADKGGWDVTQVLRFPGTTNYKYDSRPKVRVLWDDGPTYTVKKLEGYLPKELKEEAELESDEDARDIYDRYRNQMPAWLRRELFTGRPKEGKRSEMLWKIENELLETGVTQEECFVLLKASVWNKFKGRRNEDDQLRREIDKAVDRHFTTTKDEPKGKDKAKKQRAEDRDPQRNEERKFLQLSIADVEEEELDWIWYPYLARGELTILEGDPGLGKSYMAQMIGGCIVDGRAPPVVRPQGKKPVQGKVAYFDMENSAGTVTKRRLVDNNVHNLADYLQEETPFSIDDEDAIDDVYDALEKLKPTLVVFDTINTYIGKADTHKSSEVQQAFAHFRTIAKEFNCAVLVLRHLTKSKGGDKAIYRGQGSIAFTGLARVVMTVGQLPDDPETRVMAVTKINVTKAPKALCFTIDEMPNDRSKFVWGDFVDLSSDDILAFNAKKAGKASDADRVEEAKDFLTDVLDDGPVEQTKLKRMAEKRGWDWKTLVRAADALGIDKFTTGKGDRKETNWGLKEESH